MKIISINDSCLIFRCSLFLACLFLWPDNFFSQEDSIAKRYAERVISYYGETRFMINNQILKRKQIESYLLKYKDSGNEYRIFKKNNKRTVVFFSVAFVSYATAFATLKRPGNIAVFFLAGGVCFNAAAIPFAIRARRGLQKAISLHNRDALLSN